MNKKILKNLIIILIILFLLVIGIIMFLNKKSVISDENNKELEDENPPLTVDFDLRKLEDKSMLIILEEIVKNENKDIDKFYAQQVYYNTIESDVQSQWYIYGIMWKNNYKEKHNVYITIDIQEEKSLYSYNLTATDITLQQFLDNIQKIDKNKVSRNISFDENKKVNYLEYNTPAKIERYYNYYIDLVQYDSEEAYNLLDKEYREKRFGNLNNYLKYLNENKNNIINNKLEKYTAEYLEDKKEYQYSCIDKNGKYFIIFEKDILDYYIFLDEYTVDIPQFIEKYNNSDIQKKVALNIDKFIKGINDKNYNYSYSVLADSFKKNKYPTISSFESDMKNQIFDNCSVEYSVFSQQGSNYSYRITLKSGEESKSMNVIMKLGDGTNFEMSFSFE